MFRKRDVWSRGGQVRTENLLLHNAQSRGTEIHMNVRNQQTILDLISVAFRKVFLYKTIMMKSALHAGRVGHRNGLLQQLHRIHRNKVNKHTCM